MSFQTSLQVDKPPQIWTHAMYVMSVAPDATP